MSDDVPTGVFPEGTCPACGGPFRLSRNGLGQRFARELESADESVYDETPKWEINGRPPSAEEQPAEVWECTAQDHEIRVQMVVPRED
jgi:hypothetical protein